MRYIVLLLLVAAGTSPPRIARLERAAYTINQ